MRTGILLSLTRIWMSICGLGITVAAVYFASPVDFGQFAIASSIGLFFCMLLGSGTHERVLARLVDPVEAHAFASVTGIAFAAVLCGLAVVSDRSGTPVMTLTFLAYAVNCLGWGSSNTADAMAIRDGQATKILVSNGLGDTVNLIISVAGLCTGFGVMALATAKLLQSIVQYTSFSVLVGRPLLPAFRLGNVRYHLEGFATYMLPRTSNWAESYAADLFIGSLLSAVAAGQFRLAARFSSAFQSVILNSLNVVMISEVGRRSMSALKTTWILRIAPQAIVLIGFAGMVFALIVSASLVRLKDGAWTDAAMVVLWISAAIPALVVNGAVVALLTARQSTQRLAGIQIVRLVGGSLGLIAGTFFGTIACAAGRSLANLGLAGGSMWAALRQQRHVRLMVSVLARQSLVGVSIALLGAVVDRTMPGGMSAPVNLLGLLGALIVLQAALTYGQLHTIVREARLFLPGVARLRRQAASPIPHA